VAADCRDVFPAAYVCFCIKLQSLGVKAIGRGGACMKHMTDVTAFTGTTLA